MLVEKAREIQALKFERVFNKAVDLHVTLESLGDVEKRLDGLKNQELAYRVHVAFGNAFQEGRIQVHNGDQTIGFEKKAPVAQLDRAPVS